MLQTRRVAGKLVAVKAHQAIGRTDPKPAIGVLCQRLYLSRGQALLGPKDPKYRSRHRGIRGVRLPSDRTDDEHQRYSHRP